MFGRALGEHRHLRLDLHVTGVRAPRAAGILEGPLFDDLRAELGRGPPVALRQRAVFRMRAFDDEPFVPALGHEELRQRVGQHCAARCDMKDVGATVGAPEPIVRRARVQNQDIVAGRLGQRQRGVGVGEGRNEPNAVRDERLERGNRLLGTGGDFGRGECLTHETAGRHVVGSGEAPSGEPQVLGRQVEPRNRQWPGVDIDPKHRRDDGRGLLRRKIRREQSRGYRRAKRKRTWKQRQSPPFLAIKRRLER